MTATIKITKEAHNAIRSLASSPTGFKMTAHPTHDGYMVVQISDEVYAALRKKALASETSFSDIIIRLVGTKKGLN